MLKRLGVLIEKKPLLVILIILIITAGFLSLIPSIEMKTDFEDFMPQDETVDASTRISKYFGTGTTPMFLYLENKETESMITPETLRKQEYVSEELLEIPEVSSVTSIVTFINQICQIEFGKNLSNCTDEEINIAVSDLLTKDYPNNIKLFEEDDSNEAIDYNRYPRISKGKSVDEIDIKNCYLSYDEEKFEFTIEVYDLSSFNSEIISPLKPLNVVEWYINFENLIKPDERLDISYRISAHLEPKNTIWTIGNGFFNNLKNIFSQIKNKELINNYKSETYLWIKASESPMYFPLPLNTANISFEIDTNKIIIDVSREELGNFGIAPSFGFFELPAKLTHFSAGTRYYQTGFAKLPWLRISANTSYLLDKLDKIMNRPILGNIAENILKKLGDISYEELISFLDNPDGYIPVSDTISLKDIEQNWVNTDKVYFDAPSTNQLFIKPFLFDDLKLASTSFISKDYLTSNKPHASLFILNIKLSDGYNQVIDVTETIQNKVASLDTNNLFTIELTGDGVISQEMNEITEESNQIIMPMIFIIILSILFFSFRKISYIFLPLIGLGVSTVWLFGTMVLLNIPFTTIAVALVPLILGLGVDYSVHLLHNYRTELGKGKTPGQAIKSSILEIGSAMFLAMLTTVIAFLSFLTASLPPIRDFGLLLAFGIIYTFINAITLQAALRYVLDRRKKEFNNKEKKKYKLDVLMGVFAKKLLRHQKKVIIIIFSITLIFAFGAVQIQSGFNFNSFIPEDNKAIQIYDKIGVNFPFSGQDQEYILLEGDVATVETLEGIRKTHENLEDDNFVSKNADGTVKATSIYTIIINAAKNNNSLLDDFNINQATFIPNSDKDVKNLYNYLLSDAEYSMQVKNLLKKDDGQYKATIIRVYVDIISEGVETLDLTKDIQVMYNDFNNDLADYGNVDVIITGQLVIIEKITGSLTDSQIISTGISILLATIVLIITYKRPSLGIIAMIPVLISIIWILGTMFFIGYILDILTITVTSLTIGIGIDYAIHTTQRFRLVADRTGNIEKAVCETISRTGGALLIAALTTTMGFATLILAPIPPEQKFGVITALTITFSFITSVLLLPLLLARWAKWSKKKKGYIISDKPADDDYFDEVDLCE